MRDDSSVSGSNNDNQAPDGGAPASPPLDLGRAFREAGLILLGIGLFAGTALAAGTAMAASRKKSDD